MKSVKIVEVSPCHWPMHTPPMLTTQVNYMMQILFGITLESKSELLTNAFEREGEAPLDLTYFSCAGRVPTVAVTDNKWVEFRLGPRLAQTVDCSNLHIVSVIISLHRYPDITAGLTVRKIKVRGRYLVKYSSSNKLISSRECWSYQLILQLLTNHNN